MDSLAVVDVVDKRLERLRGVIPKSQEEVVDLLSQYGKAMDALMHARKVHQPKSRNGGSGVSNGSNGSSGNGELSCADNAIDHRLEIIAQEKQKLVDWQHNQHRNNNGNNNYYDDGNNNSNDSYDHDNNSNASNNNTTTTTTTITTTTTTATNSNNNTALAMSGGGSLRQGHGGGGGGTTSPGKPTTPSKGAGAAMLANRALNSSLPQYQSWSGNLVHRRSGALNLIKHVLFMSNHRSLPVPNKKLASINTRFFKKGKTNYRLRAQPQIESPPESPPTPDPPLLVQSTLSASNPIVSPLTSTMSTLLLSTVIDRPTEALRLADLQIALRIAELTTPAERKVLNEISDLTSLKSAELYDLLWEVRQLDRAISRILNVQLDISELHTILPGGSMGLAVACVPQPAQLPLRTVVSTLRTQPALLAETLLRAGYLAVDQDRSFKSTHYELSQAITFSLFGNCVNPADEKLFLYLLRRITKCQLSVAPTDHLFGKNESFALTLFSTYMNCTYGKPYLICTFKDLVASVLQENSLNFESDPQKKALLMHDLSHNPEELADNQMVLQHFAALFAKRITIRLTPLPYGIRWFSKSIIELWKARLAGSPNALRRSSSSSPNIPPPHFASAPMSPPPSLTPTSVEWQLLCHVVIENIFVPTIIRPEHFGVASGLPISHRRRNNLIHIARMVLDFFSDPASIPQDLHHIINERMISSYFAALTQVDDPDTHLRSDPQEHHSVLVSSTDLVLLLELVFQNQTCDSDFMKLVQIVQPAVAVLQEGMQFLVVEVGNDEPPKKKQPEVQPQQQTQEQQQQEQQKQQKEQQQQQPNGHPPNDHRDNADHVAQTHATRTSRRSHFAASSPLVLSPSDPVISLTSLANSAPTPVSPALLSEAALLRAAKQNLRLALSVLDPVCGPAYLPMEDLLLLQCGRNLSFDAHVMEAHVSETIRCLTALPQRYRDDNYKMLLSAMFDDHQAQQRTSQERKQGLILHLNSTQRHIAQLQAQKRMNIELLTDIKFKQFRDKIYGRMQATFINEFHDACTNSGGNLFCACYPSIHPNKNVVCGKCRTKVERVQSFLARCRDALVSSIWWKYSSEEEIEVAMHALERNLFIHIHAWVFCISKEDERFAENLRKKSASISMHDVFVARKFHSQTPWSLAQEEIKKINIYKSPHDKVKSIIGCWNIIFTYTRPYGDDTGPDDYLPILAYVIIKSQPLHLLSNLQYILLYTTLDPSDEVWVVNFLSAVEVVREVTEGDLPQHGWTNGVVERSFLFPSLPIPSERPRKLLHKHKTRHPKYDTL